MKLKKKQVVTYCNTCTLDWSGHTGPHKLKVIATQKKWGDLYVLKCKTVGKHNWYKEVYITVGDIHEGRVIL
jgi:hypothetical protein